MKVGSEHVPHHRDRAIENYKIFADGNPIHSASNANISGTTLIQLIEPVKANNITFEIYNTRSADPSRIDEIEVYGKM